MTPQMIPFVDSGPVSLSTGKANGANCVRRSINIPNDWTLATLILQSLFILAVIGIIGFWILSRIRSRGKSIQTLSWSLLYGSAIGFTLADYALQLAFTASEGCDQIYSNRVQWHALVITTTWIRTIGIFLLWATALIPTTRVLLEITEKSEKLSKIFNILHCTGLAVLMVFVVMANSFQSDSVLDAQTSFSLYRYLRYGSNYINAFWLYVVWEAFRVILSFSFGAVAIIVRSNSSRALRAFLILTSTFLFAQAITDLIIDVVYTIHPWEEYSPTELPQSQTATETVVSFAFSRLFQILALLFLLLVSLNTTADNTTTTKYTEANTQDHIEPTQALPPTHAPGV